MNSSTDPRTESPARVAIFLETEHEVGRFLASGACPRGVVVAAAPPADFAAESANITYRRIEDLYDEVELLSFGDSGWEHLDSICRTVDRILGVEYGASLPEFSAHYYALSVKMFVDSLLRAGFVVRKALAALDVAQVYYYPPASSLPINEIGAIDTDKLFGYVLPLVCAGQGISCHPLGTPENVTTPPAPRSAGVMSDVRRGIKRLLRVTAPGILAALRGRSATTVVVHRIWCDDGFQRLRKGAMRVIPVSTLVEDAPTPAERSFDLTPLQPLFQLNGIDFFPLASVFFDTLVHDWYPRHRRIVSRLEPALASLGRVVVAGAGPVTVRDVATAVAARRVEVPSVVVQHGGFIGYAKYPILYLNDVFLSDHFVSWGEGVTDELSHIDPDLPGAMFRQPMAFHSLGSPRMCELRTRLRTRPRKREGRKLRVVYVMTTLPRSFRYFSWNLYPDILAWRMQRRVIELLRSYDDVELILKPGRGDGNYNPLLKWLAGQGGGHIPVRTDVSLADLLLEQEVDITILDTPATTLLEAICGTNKVVALFLDTHLRLTPVARELLRRRAVVSETTEDYLADIKHVVEEALAGSSEESDDAFLASYALGGDTAPFEAFADLLQRSAARSVSHSGRR